MEKWIETSGGNLLNLGRVDFLEIVSVDAKHTAFELRAALAHTGIRMKVMDGTKEKCQAVKLGFKASLNTITWR